ncbi:bestrophin family protein [Aestuariivirga sp.]|uniref:bestrophin family protein n=1 Tax=Aestuariivirga sp. TaxID=2650926 RepID=UPI0039E4D343
MIVRESPRPWELLFIMRGSIVPDIWPQVAVVVAISALTTFLDLSGILHIQPIAALPFSLIGIALSIFSGFRNSASYERWWEARKLLGQHVIDARSLAREAASYLDEAAARRLVLLTIAFVAALRDHLRGNPQGADVAQYVENAGCAMPPATSHVPDRLLGLMSKEVADALQSGKVTAPIAQVMEERIVSLSGVLAGAERIKFTPLPYAYSLLLHRTAYMFCLLLPFGLAETTGLWTPLLSAILAYTFFGLDALGDQLSQPFGTGDNALPLAAITRTIEINLCDMIGETAPPQLHPVEYLLT